MITKQDIDNILKDVNRVLAALDERLVKLETAPQQKLVKKTNT
jgi:hypothetical protein